jgi:hypothetical protein
MIPTLIRFRSQDTAMAGDIRVMATRIGATKSVANIGNWNGSGSVLRTRGKALSGIAVRRNVVRGSNWSASVAGPRFVLPGSPRASRNALPKSANVAARTSDFPVVLAAFVDN